jgi:FMN reductase
MSTSRPLIVGIGGTTGGTSSTETALRAALAAAEDRGARTILFGGEALAMLPHYNPKSPVRTVEETALVEAVRAASGLIVASPGYHGNISGLVKNALDLIEDTARDALRPYLTDLPVGLITTAYGWQATGSTIAALRSIVHAFRGWPTPFAAAINSRLCRFDDTGCASETEVMEQLALVGCQVTDFALRADADRLSGALLRMPMASA